MRDVQRELFCISDSLTYFSSDAFALPLQPMTPQQLVGIGIRLLALWWLYHGAQSMLQLLFLFNDPATAGIRDSSLFPGIVATVFYVLAAIFFWNAPMWTAHKLIPRTAHDNVLNVSLFDTARVGCALIGIWVLATTLQNVVWFLTSVLIASGSGSAFMAMTRENRVSFFVDVFQIALGFALVFRSHWFARLMTK